MFKLIGTNTHFLYLLDGIFLHRFQVLQCFLELLYYFLLAQTRPIFHTFRGFIRYRSGILELTFLSFQLFYCHSLVILILYFPINL